MLKNKRERERERERERVDVRKEIMKSTPIHKAIKKACTKNVKIFSFASGSTLHGNRF